MIFGMSDEELKAMERKEGKVMPNYANAGHGPRDYVNPPGCTCEFQHQSDPLCPMEAETSGAPAPDNGVLWMAKDDGSLPRDVAAEFEINRMNAELQDWKAEAERLRAAHKQMHKYLREIGDSGCEMCEALARIKEGTK